MSSIIELVIENLDNDIVLEFYQNKKPLDSSNFTNTKIVFIDNDYEIDSNNFPTAIKWLNNKLTLTLGMTSISVGIYSIRVVVYDNDHPNGVAILHEYSDTTLKLQVIK